MKNTNSNTIWMLAIAGSLCMVAAAVGVAQNDGVFGRNAQALNVPSTASAQDLSRVFRGVSSKVMPGVVSIVTQSKAIPVQGGFDEMFKSDPQMREFFQRSPQFRQFLEQPQQPRRRRGQGSGFVADADGHIVTNSHVVKNADKMLVRFHDGREFDGELIGIDERSDVAVIKIDPPKDIQPLAMGNSDLMQIGDWVMAVGSPFGLEMSVTSGIISAKGRGPGINEREDFIQTDAAINPGNSGGPLVNLNGEVIAINTAISTRSGGYDGVGFAIPINMAKWVTDQLIENGSVQRAYIGVAIQPITNTIAKQLNTALGRGALVSQIMEDSPAANSGLETGDVILKLNGKDVNGTRSLQGIVEQLSVGKTYDMQVLRDGKKKTLDITMKAMPEEYSLASRGSLRPQQKETEKVEANELGIEVKELTDEIAEQLDLDGVTGVVVSSVNNDGPGARAGIKAGDVIEKVGKTKVRTVDEFEKALENVDVEEGVLLLVRNGNATRFIVIQKD